MDSTVPNFSATIAENYDRYLAAMLLAPYAAILANEVPAGAKSILETACGTGLATDKIRALVPDAKIIATDLSDGMIDIARKRNLPGVEWRQADAQDLPFPSNEFDCVVCNFGFMFFPDKDVAANEAFRVLKKGGVWAMTIWDSRKHNDIARMTKEICGTFYGEDPPPFFEIPYGYHDPVEIERVIRGALFEDVRVDPVETEATSPSGIDAATGLLEGNPIYLDIVDRGIETLAPMKAALGEALEKSFGKPIRGRQRAFVCTARKP